MILECKALDEVRDAYCEIASLLLAGWDTIIHLNRKKRLLRPSFGRGLAMTQYKSRHCEESRILSSTLKVSDLKGGMTKQSFSCL